MKKKELFLVSFLLFLDRISKRVIENYLGSQILEVIPNFFELQLVYNTGAAWSIFENQVFLFIIIGFLSLIVLSSIKKNMSESKTRNISFSLLYAGILGNLIDRIIFHHVKDFLSFHIFHYAFPIFNFADICIVIGTLLLSIEILKGESYGNHICHKRRKSKN